MTYEHTPQYLRNLKITFVLGFFYMALMFVGMAVVFNAGSILSGEGIPVSSVMGWSVFLVILSLLFSIGIWNQMGNYFDQ